MTSILRKAIAPSLAALFVFPATWLLYVSLIDRVQLFGAGSAGLLQNLTLENYHTVFVIRDGLSNVSLTFGVSISVGLVASFVAFFFLVSNFLFNLKKPVSEPFLLPAFAMPGIVIAVPFFFYVSLLGLPNLLSWFLGLLATGLIVAVLMLSGYMEDLPRSSVAALALSKASPMKKLGVIMSSMRSELAVVGVFCFLFSWQDLAISLVTGEAHSRSMTVEVMGLITPIGTYWGEIAALSAPAIFLAFAFAILSKPILFRGFSFGR